VKHRVKTGIIEPRKALSFVRDRPNSQAAVSNGRLGHKRVIEPIRASSAPNRFASSFMVRVSDGISRMAMSRLTQPIRTFSREDEKKKQFDTGFFGARRALEVPERDRSDHKNKRPGRLCENSVADSPCSKDRCPTQCPLLARA
jgi:hypothetical protein